MDAATSPISGWDNFYVIVGSSAAALTGLQFVVVTLIAQSRRRATGQEISAFGSPTVVHFCAALFISAALSAPWASLVAACVPIGACGAAGLGYTVLVTRRARRQTGYKPVFEDWLWHVALPFISYGTLLETAFGLYHGSVRSLFAIAAATLLLVFIGIHNAWDTVIYLTLNHLQPPDQ